MSVLALGWARWRLTKAAVFIFLLIFFGGIFLWQLDSFASGLSRAELGSINQANLSSIVANPINAPYHLLQYGLLSISQSHKILLARSASVICGIIFIISFYFLVKKWFGLAVGLLCVLLFGTTPLFILAARNAAPDIMFFLPILIVATGFWMSKSGYRNLLAKSCFITSVALFLYVPGAAWVLLVAALISYKTLIRLFYSSLPLSGLFLSGLFLAILSPLVISGYKDFSVIKSLLLIPDSVPHVTPVLKHTISSLSALVYQSSNQNSLQIAKLPLLDVAQIGLGVFGGYVMWERLKKDFFVIVFTFLIIIAATSLSSQYGLLAMILPLVGILGGMGLRYLYIEWKGVFPKNPLAKSFAVIVMAAVIVIHVGYGVRYSLIAWPKLTATKHEYVLKY